MLNVVAPLPNWNVRGWSYLERTDTGELHPGADLNVGGGDDDLGLPVVAMLDGVVAARCPWDGRHVGYGNFGLIEHRLGNLTLWTLYAHLDSFDEAFVPGAPVAAGQRIGACGKSGFQRWAHLHLEVRYFGPGERPADYWPGGLDIERISDLYADPFTCLRLAPAAASLAPQLDATAAGGNEADADATAMVDALQRDRDFNYRLKMTFEAALRDLEAAGQLSSGTTDRLIAAAA